MTRSILFVLALTVNLAAQAQGGFTCGHNELHRMASLHENRPDRLQQIVDAQADLEAFTQQFAADEAMRGGGGPFIIPVVFHIIHNNGPENVSDEQVYDAMRILNEDFNKLNDDWDNVNQAFLGIVADVEVEFRLAQKDPDGNCTKGITRTVSALTNDGTQTMKDLIQWPRNMYLNVWVSASADGAAGYTFLPGSVSNSWGAAADGIVILHDYTGSIGTGAPGRSRALTHEVGHWINLRHTWGNSNTPAVASNCNEDDLVSDTPNTIGWTSCNVNGVSCGSLDNVENYMEYSYCSKMFTEGQKTRMLAALNSSTAQRNNLWAPANLVATGVAGSDILCAADFMSNVQVVCAGDSVTFTDVSYNGVTSRDWAFPGAQPATSTDAVVTVQYPNPGTYPVTLTAGNGQSTVTATQNDYIIVLPASGSAVPYTQDFEGVGSLPANEWFVWNPDGAETFELSTLAGYSGTRSIRLRNDVSDDGDKDELISTTYDMTGATTIGLSFRVAFARNNADNDDILRVLVSKDCGETWSMRRQLRGATSLPTVPDQTANFTPNNPSQWQLVEVVNISSTYAVPDFRFKIYFESDGGNNVWIDDINLNGAPVGLDELAGKPGAVQVVPNPASGEAHVVLDLRSGGRARITVLNMLGQEVVVLADGPLAAGAHRLPVPVDALARGVYTVRVQQGGTAAVERFVVE